MPDVSGRDWDVPIHVHVNSFYNGDRMGYNVGVKQNCRLENFCPVQKNSGPADLDVCLYHKL